jgi:hypothetical protein
LDRSSLKLSRGGGFCGRSMARPGFNHRYQRFARKNPAEGYWVRLGFSPKTSRSLVKAGLRNVADLAGWSREQVAALPWLAKRSLARLEQVRGAPLPSRRSFWEQRGVPPIVRNALARAGIDSLEKLGKMTREELLSFPRLGKMALRECERVLGRPLDSPLDAWRQRGLPPHAAYCLARGGIRTVEHLAALSPAALRVLGLTRPEVETCLEIARQSRGPA